MNTNADYPQRKDYDGHAAYAEAAEAWAGAAAQAAGPRDPAHTCLEGPLCSYWHSPSYTVEDPGLCVHDSCNNITHVGCVACFTEAMDAEYARPAEPVIDAADPRCLFDGLPLTCRGAYGAPGAGQSWGCECGHEWAKTGGSFHDPAGEAHILSIRDVM